ALRCIRPAVRLEPGVQSGTFQTAVVPIISLIAHSRQRPTETETEVGDPLAHDPSPGLCTHALLRRHLPRVGAATKLGLGLRLFDAASSKSTTSAAWSKSSAEGGEVEMYD